jgi:hypothetical protein
MSYVYVVQMDIPQHLEAGDQGATTKGKRAQTQLAHLMPLF